MRFLILILAAFCGLGCEFSPSTQVLEGYKERHRTNEIKRFKEHSMIIEFEGHEYIWFSYGQGVAICHKENCKFCLEKERE